MHMEQKTTQTPSWSGYLSWYSDLLRAGRSGSGIPVGGEFFRTCSDIPWGQPSFLHNGCRVFPGGKAAGAGVNYPPHLEPKLNKE
jgi:hypothetical protein